MGTNRNHGGNDNHTATIFLTSLSHILIKVYLLVSTQLPLMSTGLRESSHMSVAFLVEITLTCVRLSTTIVSGILIKATHATSAPGIPTKAIVQPWLSHDL